MATGNGRNSGTASAKGLSSFVLKVVAIVGMTCNHAAYVFAGHLPFVGECVLFAVGGVTFPVMAYLLVEGYRHTSNVKRYALRLAAFAAVSQIPYALYLASNANVLFTLLIGLGLLYLDDHASSRAWYGAGVVAGTLVSLVCDWGFLGIVMIVLFKYLQDQDGRQGRASLGAVALPVLVAVVSLSVPALGEVALSGLYALPALLYPLVGCSASIPLLAAYNGRRGKPMKWFFYAYYPLHIAVLGIAAQLLFP